MNGCGDRRCSSGVRVAGLGGKRNSKKKTLISGIESTQSLLESLNESLSQSQRVTSEGSEVKKAISASLMKSTT